MFASKTFTEHLARGGLGIALIVAAVLVGRNGGVAATAASVVLGVTSLVALRGCPMCWTTGLVKMIRARRPGVRHSPNR